MLKIDQHVARHARLERKRLLSESSLQPFSAAGAAHGLPSARPVGALLVARSRIGNSHQSIREARKRISLLEQENDVLRQAAPTCLKRTC